MGIEEFKTVLEKIKGYTDYLYFHLMGEPLFSANLKEFLNLAETHGFKVIITTNGTLLNTKSDILLN